MKGIIVSLLVVFSTVFFCGCHTVYRTVEGTVSGVKEDTNSVIDALEKADQWFEDQYW